MRPARARQPAHALTALVCLLLAVPAVAQDAAPALRWDGKRTVIAGGHGDLPPFEFVGEHGEPRGFAVDLLNEIAAEAGLSIEIRLGAWDATLEDAKAGRIDLIVGMHETAERRESFRFSDSYSDLPYDVFVHSGVTDIRSLDDLARRRVLVQRRSMGQRLAERAGALPVAVDTPRDVMRELQNGTCDAALLARYPGLWLASEMKLDKVVPVGLDIPPRQYGFATAKGNEALIQALNRGLTAVKQSGRYREIWDRWFSVQGAPPPTLREVLRYVAWILGPLATVLILWALWTWSLRIRVRDRTRQFEQELAVRRAAETALAAEREQLAVTLRSIVDAVIQVDREGRVVMVNEGAETLFGWTADAVRGRPVDEVLPLRDEMTGEAPDAVRSCLAGRPVAELRHAAFYQGPLGHQRLVIGTAGRVPGADGRAAGAVLVLRDVGERRRLERELARTDKLESLGVLAGGIAHDFNNVLAAILGNLSLARDPLPGVDTGECLRRAEEAANRARDLTGQLLTFARGGALVKRVEALGDLVRDAATFILSGSASKVDVRIAPDLWPAEVDAGQLVQVVHNLTLNAAQAMPGGGIVHIEASNILLAEGNPWTLEAGSYVRVRVVDHGVGIPREKLTRVFEPFFTTKVRGSGLGLSVCYSIVARHGGRITVESEPGVGTTFTVLLPASPGATAGQAAAQEGAPVPGTGRILVMDDDALLRDTLLAELRHLGYEPVAVPDGSDAVAAYREAMRIGHPFAAVLLDLTVAGGVGGHEALQRLRDLDPGVRAVICTGYCNDPIVAEFRQAGFAGVILKPFSIRQLSLVLEDALRRPATPFQPLA